MVNFYLPHVALTVSDVQKTKKFYSTIGFLIKQDSYSEGKKRHVLLLEGFGLEIEIFYFSDQPQHQEFKANYKIVGFQHIALPVQNLEEMKEKITKNGISLREDIRVTSLGVRNFTITDPSGITIEFFEAHPE